MDLSEFRKLLEGESPYPLNDEIFNLIISNSETLHFGKGEAIVDIGETKPGIYIIKKGVVRGYINEDGTERNHYFGLSGTVLASMHCYFADKPSILCIEACNQCEILHIPQRRFKEMLEESHALCLWINGVLFGMQYFQEVKSKIMNGDSQWRYKWLMNCRPEILQAVPLKAIASYLGMSEVHISRIRKDIYSGYQDSDF